MFRDRLHHINVKKQTCDLSVQLSGGGRRTDAIKPTPVYSRGVAETHVLVSSHLFQKVHDLEGGTKRWRGMRLSSTIGRTLLFTTANHFGGVCEEARFI